MNEEAKAIRIQWMTEYGLNEQDIADSVEFDPPESLEKEQDELDAVRSLQKKDAKIDTKWLGDLMKQIYIENGFPEDSKFMVCIRCREIVQFDEDGNAYCSHFDERPNELR